VRYGDDYKLAAEELYDHDKSSSETLNVAQKPEYNSALINCRKLICTEYKKAVNDFNVLF
jgi:hypothetical protein